MPAEQQENLAAIFKDPESVAAKAISNPSMILRIWSAKVANSRRWRSAEIPAGNAHTNARAFATLYGRSRIRRKLPWRAGAITREHPSLLYRTVVRARRC